MLYLIKIKILLTIRIKKSKKFILIERSSGIMNQKNTNMCLRLIKCLTFCLIVSLIINIVLFIIIVK